MIISASRRTDIPSFYFDWFCNRLDEGFVLVRNPMNPTQVSRVDLTPDAVTCIAFWTKDPAPLLNQIDRLAGYSFYVQFSINPYGWDLERNLRPKDQLIETFQRLSDLIGPDRVIWRYSPVVISNVYTSERHIQDFTTFAQSLNGYTRHCWYSVLDMYAKIEKRMAAAGVIVPDDDERIALSRTLLNIAAENGIGLRACGDANLVAAGIPQGRCIDPDLVERITGRSVSHRKDPGQRGLCACATSVDIGTYQTCAHGCAYCYANHSDLSVSRTRAGFDPASPLLCSTLGPDDRVIDRKVPKKAPNTQLPLL